MKKILCTLLVGILITTTAFAVYDPSMTNANLVIPQEYVEQGYDVNKYIDEMTTTAYSPYLKNYHMTLVETLNKGKKGGEGFQCMYAYERHDINPDYVVRGYDTCGVLYSHDGGDSWHLEEWSDENKGLLSSGINDLEFHPDNPNIVFSYRWGRNEEKVVAGLYLSVDGGKTSRRIYKFARRKNRHNYDGWIKFGAFDEEKDAYPFYMVQSNTPTWGDAGLYRAYLPKDYDGTEELDFEKIAFKDAKKDGLIRRFTISDDGSFMIATIGWEWDETNSNWVKANSGKVYYSTDGINWELRNGGIENFCVSQIAIDTMNNSHWVMSPLGVAETEEGKTKGYVMLYETFNKGETWTKLPVEDWNVPNELSQNGNVEWKDGKPATMAMSRGDSEVSTSWVIELKFTYPVEVDGVLKNQLLVGVDESTWPYRISKDGGKTFSYINHNEEDYLGKDETGWYADPLCVSKAAPDEVLWGIFKSDDNGETYDWNDSGVSGKLATSFIWDAKGQLSWIGGFDMGIFEAQKIPDYTGDFPPIKPHRRKNAFANTTANDLAADPNDPNHIWGIAGSTAYEHEDILVSTTNNFQNSMYWVNMQMLRRAKAKTNNVVDYPHIMVEYAPPNSTYEDDAPEQERNKNTLFTGLFYSDDNGLTWRESEYKIKGVSPFNPKICYAMGDKANNTSNQLMISYDGAKTWQSTGLSFSNIGTCFMVDRVEDYVVWFGAEDIYKTQLYRVDLKTGSINTYGKENGLDIDADRGLQLSNIGASKIDPNVMFVSGTDYYGLNRCVFISYNAGKTWMKIPEMPPGTTNLYADFHPMKRQLWMGGHLGIWVFDYGAYYEDNKDKIDGYLN